MNSLAREVRRLRPEFALLVCSLLPGCASTGPGTQARNRFEHAGVLSDGFEPGPWPYPGQQDARRFSESGGQEPEPWEVDRRLQWRPQQTLLQGYIGASFFERVAVEGGSAPPVDGDEGDLDQLPLLGGGAQWKLGGKRIDLGFEGLFSFAGRANAVAFVAGGGGALVAVDVDLVLVDLYGGPFASLFLGDKLRLYAGAGPLMQFAEFDQTGGPSDESGSGFGTGVYARTGLELLLPSHTLVGIGVRWSESRIDLDGGLGDLEVDGLQAFLTVTEGL